MRPRLNSLVLLLVLLTLAVVPAQADQKQERKVRSAKWVAEELFDHPDRRLPQALLEQTRCVAIFPDVPRAAFGPAPVLSAAVTRRVTGAHRSS
jgi:lipid-binding SYLF domain-containing protein